MKLKVCQNKGTTYLINEMREQADVLWQNERRNAFLMKILLVLQTFEFSNEKNYKQLG